MKSGRSWSDPLQSRLLQTPTDWHVNMKKRRRRWKNQIIEFFFFFSSTFCLTQKSKKNLVIQTVKRAGGDREIGGGGDLWMPFGFVRVRLHPSRQVAVGVQLDLAKHKGRIPVPHSRYWSDFTKFRQIRLIRLIFHLYWSKIIF